MDEASSALGVLGGTFDPIHNAHLRLALEARSAGNLSEVCLVPAGQPPHRSSPVASPADRLAMARLAVAELPGLSIDAGEVESPQPSYTVHTLERLRLRVGPARPLVLIVGADAFTGLASWFRWRTLFELAHVLVATRPGHTLDPLHMAADLAAEHGLRQGIASDFQSAPAGRIVQFAMTPMEISATAVRLRLASGNLPQEWLPPDVLDYISRNHLYENKN